MAPAQHNHIRGEMWARPTALALPTTILTNPAQRLQITDLFKLLLSPWGVLFLRFGERGGYLNLGQRAGLENTPGPSIATEQCNTEHTSCFFLWRDSLDNYPGWPPMHIHTDIRTYIHCCVCAPSDDYVIGCLLTRRGSKMLGTHQMVDGVNCMFGYCVLIGCLATERGRQ